MGSCSPAPLVQEPRQATAAEREQEVMARALDEAKRVILLGQQSDGVAPAFGVEPTVSIELPPPGVQLLPNWPVGRHAEQLVPTWPVGQHAEMLIPGHGPQMQHVLVAGSSPQNEAVLEAIKRYRERASVE